MEDTPAKKPFWDHTELKGIQIHISLVRLVAVTSFLMRTE